LGVSELSTRSVKLRLLASSPANAALLPMNRARGQDDAGVDADSGRSGAAVVKVPGPSARSRTGDDAMPPRGRQKRVDQRRRWRPNHRPSASRRLLQRLRGRKLTGP
jgi:hypothetical protein